MHHIDIVLPFDDFTLFANLRATIRSSNALSTFFRSGAVTHTLEFPDIIAPARHNSS